MAHKIVSFSTTGKMERYLNGYVTGGKSLASPSGVVIGLHGLTLLIDVGGGAKTVTFADATGAGLPLRLGASSIKEQILAVSGLGSLLISFDEGKIVLGYASAGVTVKGTGTSNPIFGFAKSDTVGVVYAPADGSAPRVLGTGSSPRGDSYYAHLEVS